MRLSWPARFGALAVAGFAIAAAPAPAPATPQVDLTVLEANGPGWQVGQSHGSAESGSLTLERTVWPLFYLHWRPLEEPAAGREVSPEEANKVLADLWEGLLLDGPLQTKRRDLPQHPAVSVETNADHGQMRIRYWVWACPESRRLLIAEAIVSLKTNAPAELTDWMEGMVRSVRCHAGAHLETSPRLDVRYDVPASDLSYARASTWSSPSGYRVQRAFGAADLTPASPARTVQQGQELAVALDAEQEVHLAWGREEDFPMSFDVLRSRTEEYWRGRAMDLVITGFKSAADVWIAEGVTMRELHPTGVPPTVRSKFRSWMWRRDGVVYFAVGRIAGFHWGRHLLKTPPGVWEAVFTRQFQALPD